MTVRELIEHLQTLPQDYVVGYCCCSDTSLMDADEICVCHAADKKVVKHHNMPGCVRDYREWEWEKQVPGGPKPGMVPEFVDIVVFPGN